MFTTGTSQVEVIGSYRGGHTIGLAQAIFA